MDVMQFKNICREAVLGQRDWTDILAALCSYVDADKAVFLSRSMTDNQQITLSYKHDRSYVQAYNSKYYLYDSRQLAAYRDKINIVRTGQDYVANKFIVDTPYYNDSLYKAGILDSLHGTVHDGPGLNRQSIVLHRSYESKLFDQIDIQKMQRLLPHLSEAVEYALTILTHRSEDQRYPEFTALLDDKFYLHSPNGNVSDIIHDCDGLYASGGYLNAETDRLKTVFLKSIERAKSGESSFFRLSANLADNNISQASIRISISPVPNSLQWMSHLKQKVILNLGRVDHQLIPDIDMFCGAFGLTHAEMRTLKALVMHEGTHAAALSAGITYKTLRWHLKNIFSKTGYRSQERLLKALFDMNISNAIL